MSRSLPACIVDISALLLQTLVQQVDPHLAISPDIADTRSWERENAGTQADESSSSALQRAAWGISETESDLTYGEVEQRLDLLQEQLNRYEQ